MIELPEAATNAFTVSVSLAPATALLLSPFRRGYILIKWVKPADRDTMQGSGTIIWFFICVDQRGRYPPPVPCYRSGIFFIRAVLKNAKSVHRQSLGLPCS